MAGDVDRRGVALGRVDEAGHPQWLQQERAVAAQRNHVGVGGEYFCAPRFQGAHAVHGAHAIAVGRETLGRKVPAPRDARCGRQSRQFRREAMRVAGFVARGEDPAGESLAARRQRRLDGDA
jgi:hypothetical protein